MKGKGNISYIPTDSLLDRINPLTKLVFLVCMVILLFVSTNIWFLLGVILCCTIAAVLSGIGKQYLYYLSGIVLILVLFLFIIQALFYPGNKTLLFQLSIIKVYKEGLDYAAIVSLRIIGLVGMFLTFILSTKPKNMIDMLLKKGLNPKVAYIILATLQIVPQMSRKSQKIKDSQVSRGLKTTGGLKTRFKAFIPLLGPLISGSLADVEERALALEIRGFNSTAKRTSIQDVKDTQIERILRYVFVIVSLAYIIWEVVK